MEKDIEFLTNLKDFAEVDAQYKQFYEKMSNYDFLSDLNGWGISRVYRDCTITDGKLYAANGELLSKDGRCMEESIPYFVNQSSGYCEDDYYGTMYIDVGDNTFVAVYYSC